MKKTIIFCIFMALAVLGYAQNASVSGLVSDVDGHPLPGVAVTVDGSSMGTITDVNGQYTLQINTGNDHLIVFSYMGMSAKEVKYIGQKIINVTLIEDNKLLDEVVVTGVQTIERGRATGSFSIINQDDMKSIYSNNLINKLEGSTPGLYIDKNNNINIRGISSMNADTSPLIVVDGFPLEGSMLNLNPADIEQVTVLKDAASASIWGIRAANGVVVVTTKRGSKDKKIKLNYIGTVTLSAKTRLSDLQILSSDQYVRLLWEDFQNDPPYISGTYGGYNQLESLYMDYDDGNINYDEAMIRLAQLGSFSNRKQIEDNFYRRALTQQHTVSLQTGTERTSTYISLNYDVNKSRLCGNEYQKLNLMLNSDINFTKNFSAYINVRATNRWQKRNGTSSALEYEPWERILNDDGSYVDESTNSVNREYQDACAAIGFKDWSKNLLKDSRMNDKKTEELNINASLRLEWKPIKGLKLSTQGTLEKTKIDTKDYYSPDHFFVRNLVNRFTQVKRVGGYPTEIVKNHLPIEGGIKDLGHTHSTSYSFRNQISYDLDINNFDFRAMVGNDIYSIEGDMNSYRLWGYNDKYQTSTAINLAELNNGVSGYSGRTVKLSYSPTIAASLERYVSWFGTAAVGYKELYNLFGSMRLDQTNMLVNASKFRNNPSWSVGAKWGLANEKFFKRPDWINTLSLRASYGLAGNIDKSTTPDMTGEFDKEYTVSTLNILRIGNPANPALGWEKTYSTNIGIDGVFFNNRLNFTLDYYHRRSKDLLSDVMNDATTGWSSFRTNSAEMINKGFEVMVQGTFIRSRNFNWDATLNFSYNHNRVTDYKFVNSPLSAIYGNPIEGRPINQLTSIRYGGLNEMGEPTFLKKGDETPYLFSRLSEITEEDLVDEGQTTPPYYGSFNTSIEWKGLTLSVFFTFQFGHKMRMPSPYVSGELYTKWSGEEYRWIEGADNTDKWVPRLHPTGNSWAPSNYTNCLIYSDRMVDKANILRLKSVRLDYDLSRWLNKIGIAGGAIGVAGENLLYWAANKEGIDPDTIEQDYFGYVTGLSVPARAVFNLTLNF